LHDSVFENGNSDIDTQDYLLDYLTDLYSYDQPQA